MKLKVPPAVQVAFFSALMWLIDRWFPASHIEFRYQNHLSRALFLIGIFLGIWAVYSFKKANTTVDPTQPEKASALVITGLYRYTRNPMYVAMLLVLLAFFLRLGNLYNLVIAGAFVLYVTEFQIKPEEKALTSLFPNEYASYKSKVRRWI